MALLYKQFNGTRIVFCLTMAALFLTFWSFSALAQTAANPAYTVEGVEVDVTAENAVKAREDAMLQAQVKAYQMLAERFLSPAELQTFKMPDPNTVTTLVQDFEVTNEQLSAVRYKGTFTVRFRPNAMKSQMASQGKVYSDVARKPILVIPVYQDGGRTVLWDGSNPWLDAWQELPADRNALQQTVLPLGDAADVAVISNDNALTYDPMQLQEMAARYQADDAAVLLATLNPLPTAGVVRLTVNVYSNNFQGPVLVQTVNVDQNPGEEQTAFLARGAAQAKATLRNNWKAPAAYAPPPAVQSSYQQPQANAPYAPPVAQQKPPVAYTRPALGPSTTFAAHAVFSSVQDWVRMKGTLDRIYGMQAVLIKTLKPREAVLELRYSGNLNALHLALQNAGIMVRSNSSGVLELYMTARTTPPIYRQ